MTVHVLLAEDSRINREIILELLESEGFVATAVADGQQALAALDEVRFDIVLMDCQMPVMDGYEATREIRRKESEGHLPRLPIIALTAHTSARYRDECTAAGMDDFLGKPVRGAVLRAVIDKWVESFKGEFLQPAAVAADALPHIDHDALAEVKTLMPQRFQALLKSFLEGTKADIEKLQSQLDTGLYKDAYDLCHGMKSVAAQMGAVRLSVMLADMETHVRALSEGILSTGDVEAVQISALRNEVVEVSELLAVYL